MSIAPDRNVLNAPVQDEASPALQATPSIAGADMKAIEAVVANRLGKVQNSMLRQIAEELKAPIVLASCLDDINVMRFSSFGLDLDSGFCRLAHASHQICQAGMQLFPDIDLCPELSFFRKRSNEDMARFYVGIPLKNAAGENVGSLAVLQESKSVAANGFSLRRFRELGQKLITNVSVKYEPETNSRDQAVEDRIAEAANKNLAIKSQALLLEHLRLTALQAKGSPRIAL